ncbi:hypothetical protein FS749_002135 [Ceratobasidium sp. UAMH 11750]|nr:hypothetical protein FS749_002135 [Ceratobasidium sp. UAMH 11750]
MSAAAFGAFHLLPDLVLLNVQARNNVPRFCGMHDGEGLDFCHSHAIQFRSIRNVGYVMLVTVHYAYTCDCEGQNAYSRNLGVVHNNELVPWPALGIPHPTKDGEHVFCYNPETGHAYFEQVDSN